VKLTIGVMGSATRLAGDESWEKLVALGREIARRDCVLVTGACPGLPYAAVQGARATGGLVVGISPGLSVVEHVEKYGSPIEGFDVLIYTGSGLMGREIENIRSSDIVIIAGGRSGTLGEFSIAYDEGRLIGVLTGTGGIADAVEGLVQLCNKATGAVVLYNDDPVRLLDRLIVQYRGEHHKHPNCFCAPPEGTVDLLNDRVVSEARV
jgi:uncharacterized protein (TIGR00725 family)